MVSRVGQFAKVVESYLVKPSLELQAQALTRLAIEKISDRGEAFFPDGGEPSQADIQIMEDARKTLESYNQQLMAQKLKKD